MAIKRIGIFADLHCGHVAGLTPPEWFASDEDDRILNEQCWSAFRSLLKAAGKLDAAVWNGDMIDGKGERSGGTENREQARLEQCQMAAEIVSVVNAPKNLLTFGTPYHTGQAEDYESIIIDKLAVIAPKLKAGIKSHQWIDVNGLVFDIKHKVGSSSIPHGRHTAVSRERLWNLLWAEREDGQPKAQIIIRSHVHYFSYAGGDGWLAMTTPALQAANTKYGARQCAGTVDWGFVVFEVESKERWTWQLYSAKLAAVKTSATKA